MSKLELGHERRKAFLHSRLEQGGGAGSFAAMSTLTEIEEAVEALPRREQETLLRHLSVRLRAPAKPLNKAMRKRWPVPPPKVSKAESQRVARRIEEEFGRVEWESWK